MLAIPANHGLVRGTATTGGTAITSPASARRISHCSAPQANDSRDDSTCAAVLLARRVASSCWNERKSSFAARAIVDPLRQRLDLREELLAVDRLDDVVARALAHSPDLVGLLALRRAQDHRDGARLRVAADRARRLEAVQARHHHVHQDEVGLQELGLEDRVLAVVARHHLVARLGEEVVQHVALGGRVVDDQDFLDGHAAFPRGSVVGAARRTGRSRGGHAAAFTCAATAFSRLSLVNGLVRYWSDPTMRPRARSNNPSFDDSMTTGVPWKRLFFLMSAQVW